MFSGAPDLRARARAVVRGGAEAEPGGLVRETKGMMWMEGVFVKLHAAAPNSFGWDIPT